MEHFSWGSAVLACTYRGLCDAVSRNSPNATISGCVLLLQLWSWERFPVGRPYVHPEPYGPELYDGVPQDWPTMGYYWVHREVIITFHASYFFGHVFN